MEPLTNTTPDIENLHDDLEIAGDAVAWYTDASTEERHDRALSMAEDYDTMRRAFQALVLCGFVSHEKLMDAFKVARAFQ